MGSLAHEMILAHFKGEELDLSRYSPVQVDLAENSLISFYEWEKRHTVEPIFCEKAIVSERLKYGGTLDLYCLLDGVYTLVDFKTGKHVYDEYFVQTSGYKNLLTENGLPVERVQILRIGRDETEGFEERHITNTDKYFSIFVNLLDIYYLKKDLGWS